MRFTKYTTSELFSIREDINSLKGKRRIPVVGVLDNIRSALNVGAMFRTADATLMEKLYLCGITPCPERRDIDKTSLGADKVVPFEYSESTIEVIKGLKAKGYMIIAIEVSKNATSVYDIDLKQPAAFIVGHEIKGVSDEVLELCDLCIEIPMLGKAHSLNVASTFAITSYALIKNFIK
jgi:23S rRNA (guanosine2251-2'-O)-methyltransferase